MLRNKRLKQSQETSFCQRREYFRQRRMQILWKQFQFQEFSLDNNIKIDHFKVVEQDQQLRNDSLSNALGLVTSFQAEKNLDQRDNLLQLPCFLPRYLNRQKLPLASQMLPLILHKDHVLQISSLNYLLQIVKLGILSSEANASIYSNLITCCVKSAGIELGKQNIQYVLNILLRVLPAKPLEANLIGHFCKLLFRKVGIDHQLALNFLVEVEAKVPYSLVKDILQAGTSKLKKLFLYYWVQILRTYLQANSEVHHFQLAYDYLQWVSKVCQIMGNEEDCRIQNSTIDLEEEILLLILHVICKAKQAKTLLEDFPVEIVLWQSVLRHIVKQASNPRKKTRAVALEVIRLTLQLLQGENIQLVSPEIQSLLLLMDLIGSQRPYY